MYRLGNSVNYLLPTCTLSSDKQLLLFGCDELNVWRREELVQNFKDHDHDPSFISSALFVSNDTCIASLNTKGTLLIWQLVDGDIINRFENYNILMDLEYSYWQKKTKYRVYYCLYKNISLRNPSDGG